MLRLQEAQELHSKVQIYYELHRQWQMQQSTLFLTFRWSSGPSGHFVMFFSLTAPAPDVTACRTRSSSCCKLCWHGFSSVYPPLSSLWCCFAKVNRSLQSKRTPNRKQRTFRLMSVSVASLKSRIKGMNNSGGSFSSVLVQEIGMNRIKFPFIFGGVKIRNWNLVMIVWSKIFQKC